MDFKKLEKASRILSGIKQLDAEIIEIDRIAMLVANGDVKSLFKLKIEDTTKAKEAEDKPLLDNDGSLFRESFHSLMMGSLGIGGIWREKKNEDKHIHSLEQELSENSTMQILGVLLCEKQTRRQLLINQLETLGLLIK
jgi:hypothetical protein